MPTFLRACLGLFSLNLLALWHKQDHVCSVIASVFDVCGRDLTVMGCHSLMIGAILIQVAKGLVLYTSISA